MCNNYFYPSFHLCAYVAIYGHFIEILMDNNLNDIKLDGNSHISTNEFVRMVLGSLQDYAIFTTDKDLVINCWCAGSTKLFGYQPEEVIGKSCDIIFTEEDKNNNIPRMEMENALKDGRAINNRWHVTKEGSLFYAYGQMFPMKDDHEELIGFVKILRDLTEKKIAEDALNKHMKELEELITHKENILAILSHDLRSPLAAIIEISDHLKSNVDDMDHSEIKQMLDILYQASTEELDMLDYLLEWARIKYASEVFSPSMLDLNNCIRKVFNLLGEVATTNSIILQNDVPAGTAVFADKKMLLSILQNLLSNALKYSRPMGIIKVSASTKNNKVLIKVEDTGIGMSKEKLEKLFKPQLKPLSHLRKEDKGAGIGLLLVKGFVEKNGGEVCAESEEGKGTAFYFTLPESEPSEKELSADKVNVHKEV